MKKQKSDLICPGCGKPTIHPVWEHDFLAVHKLETIIVPCPERLRTEKYGLEPFSYVKFSDGCDIQGRLPR